MKTRVLPAIAFILLAVMAWAVLIPESNVYSVDKTFIKSHTPANDNFALVLTADDKEDNDEDGTMDLQLSPDFSIELISLATFSRVCKIKVSPMSKMNDHQVYIFHRQLLL
jgi:hypothetical protein